MRYSPAELDALIVRAIANDRAAVESVFLHFYDPLLAFAQRIVEPDAGFAPEDLVQETMRRASRRLVGLSARGHTAFFAWLKSIARTQLLNMIEARDALKRGGGAKEVSRVTDENGVEKTIFRLLAGTGATPSLMARRNEATEHLKVALRQLDPARNRIIVLRFVQGLSHEEIADREGKSAGAVKMLLHRILSELRDMLAQEFGKSSLSD